MKPRRRRMTTHREDPSTPPGAGDGPGDARERRSRMEAAVDVPREDDPAVTSSTHATPLDRRNEEPSDGRVPEALEDAT